MNAGERLSDEARAILAYANRVGSPFTRQEIVGVAPGAAWRVNTRWPRTVADCDPIHELVCAGFVIEHDEQLVKSSTKRNPRTYKRWRLAGVDTPATLAELLVQLIGATTAGDERLEEIRAEILRRFDR